MTNSDWSLFLKKYHLGHVRFAEKILRDPDEARCVVYEAYGRILQKNYSLDKLDSICMTTVHRLSLNRLRGWNYHFSRIEDYTLILRNKSELELSIDYPSRTATGNQWPQQDRFYGF